MVNRTSLPSLPFSSPQVREVDSIRRTFRFPKRKVGVISLQSVVCLELDGFLVWHDGSDSVTLREGPALFGEEDLNKLWDGLGRHCTGLDEVELNIEGGVRVLVHVEVSKL